MKKILLIIFFINLNSYALSSVKENIINNLKNTNNFSFNFEQNINGKIEKGYCIIKYPKKQIANNNKNKFSFRTLRILKLLGLLFEIADTHPANNAISNIIFL